MPHGRHISKYVNVLIFFKKSICKESTFRVSTQQDCLGDVLTVVQRCKHLNAAIAIALGGLVVSQAGGRAWHHPCEAVFTDTLNEKVTGS